MITTEQKNVGLGLLEDEANGKLTIAASVRAWMIGILRGSPMAPELPSTSPVTAHKHTGSVKLKPKLRSTVETAIRAKGQMTLMAIRAAVVASGIYTSDELRAKFTSGSKKGILRWQNSLANCLWELEKEGVLVKVGDKHRSRKCVED